jgi:hypothetical protein
LKKSWKSSTIKPFPLVFKGGKRFYDDNRFIP